MFGNCAASFTGQPKDTNFVEQNNMLKKVLSAESWLKEKLREDALPDLNFNETILNITQFILKLVTHYHIFKVLHDKFINNGGSV
jgi:hypothetical protein